MARHRNTGSAGSTAAARHTAQPRYARPDSPVHDPVVVPIRGAHRVSAPSAMRGRVVVAAVAAGAFVAAGQTIGPDAVADSSDAATDVTLGTDAAGVAAPAGFSTTGTGGSAPAPQVLSIAKPVDPVVTEQLAKGQRLGAERAAREAEARRPLFVAPTVGRLTSGYGARWGTQHLGVDIANSVGTPIVAVADGTVIEAGPASGFGLWVQIEHDDGTITLYGHMNEVLTSVGDRVQAGDTIATIGDRGQSTGPHLHFEVWENGIDKIDPQPWLSERGVLIG